MDAGVTGHEGIVRGQDRLAVGAGELDRAEVAGGGVVEGVLGGKREAVRGAGGDRARVAGEDEGRRARGVDVDAGRAGGAGGDGVLYRNGPRSRGLERDGGAERVYGGDA